MSNNSEPHVWHANIYSNGWRASKGGTAPVIEPATGECIGSIGIGSPEDIDDAASSAAEAQDSWANMPFDQRAAILREAARLLKARSQEIDDWNVRECGSTRAKAEWERHAACEQLHMAAAMTMQPDGALYPSSVPGRMNLCRHVPVGTVGVIAPWNFPILLGMRSVAPALALGNAVILKPDPQSAVAGGLLLAQVFEEAGLPAGVLHVVPGGPATGDALVRHPKVGMISFTGSTAVGRAIGEVCGRMLKKVALELGGNNAIVVLDDADVEAATSSGAWGAFLHQGQICMQTGRHLVHRSIAQHYAARLAERARSLTVGNPFRTNVHLGPLINEKQRDRIDAIVRTSADAGATILAGGRFDRLFYEPTVLAGVTPDMAAFKEEIFGPVAPITIFESDEEAVELVNASEYGLAAAIHTRSMSRGLALSSRIRAGMVHINDQTVNNEFHVPFGGMGASGNGGRFGGPANVHEFTQTQWVSLTDNPIRYPF
ncbi:aldehyde dehydrogenase (plasmid) [Burkholderia sp. SFA1]|uniref:benzaldehyde dehydrogenase n=1 Tax=unclassified Caballeronia TaxID=2646786 RepID=UPI001F173EFE|nr:MULTISPECIES: benzaldehyde dehydrogenase [unclassified Caballeronia]MCE4545658.1 benzaldehyde dehydrogenase [Caballeronia sp. PC1]MCE4572218.1 benzaldehyde dehydrogenase [Caballeronia sp. CLC5]BBQ01010.1 aldehyde dehydrogenase [Burkholderia sp. SFA1]